MLDELRSLSLAEAVLFSLQKEALAHSALPEVDAAEWRVAELVSSV